MRRITVGLALIWLIGLVSGLYAADRKYSLILAEFGKDANGDQTQTLVRYLFTDGLPAGKEKILTTLTSDLRYDLGINQIYRDRYVITECGDVVELAGGQVLLKSPGKLVAVDENSSSVIIRAETDHLDGIFSFDLRSRHFQRVKRHGLWSLDGTISPNGRLIANGRGGEIWLQYPSRRRVRLGSDFWRQGIPMCNEMLTPTFIWLDDTHLLTQRGNGHLVMVDTEGEVEPLVTIPNVDAPPCGPKLERDHEGHIYYEGKDRAWSIDTGKRMFEPYHWRASGNGFEVEYETNPAYGKVIRYHRVEVGRWWCDFGSIRTAPGHIAMAIGPVESNLGCPEGIKVWSVENHSWTTIKPEWLAGVVGWIEE